MAENEFLAAALRYAADGWKVFPCKPGDKPPLTAHGFKDASADPAHIRAWWTANPKANIGLACGASGLVVVDVDGAKGGFTSWPALKEEHGIDDETLTSLTGGGGWHLVYAAPAGFDGKDSICKLGQGLDVRANGGYIIAPPSVHPSGGRYEWDTTHASKPAPLPDNLRRLLERKPATDTPAPAPAPAPVVRQIGGNDDYLTAEQCLERLASWRCDNYQAWVEVGMALSELGAGGLELWDWWSRGSGKYRDGECAKKWPTFTPGDGLTLGSLVYWADMDSPRTAPPPTARPAPVDAAAPTSGQDAGGAPTSGQDAPATAPRKRITSADLVDFLTSRDYSFRKNEADDSIEANGERMSDVIHSQIRCQLRDAGLGKYLAAADDAMVADAARHAYHPVRDYLESLTWDGGAHIAKLAGYVQDTNNVFPLYLRKWLIGSVARAYTPTQNAMLVLDGSQGIGKSQFVRWLCPLPKLFVDSNINPDDKDCSLLALRSWVWEVSELGATIKRADVEALKGFLSRKVFTLRPPYGHYEIVKPALASFIGTVNNSSGIFSDSTGNRRFWATTVTGLNWQYERDIDIHQVWAEAMQAYQEGESWTLTTEQAERADRINQDDYAVSDPVEDLLRKHYNLDPARGDMWTSTADILQTLQNNGLGQNARANSMYLAATLKRLGHGKEDRSKVRGYLGIW